MGGWGVAVVNGVVQASALVIVTVIEVLDGRVNLMLSSRKGMQLRRDCFDTASVVVEDLEETYKHGLHQNASSDR